MFDDPAKPAVLRPQELEAVYAISRAVAGTVDIDAALDEIIQLARPVFIFDNFVLFLRRSGDNAEPAYARAIGRGRSREAELAWGDVTAADVLEQGHAVIRTEEADDRDDRTRTRYILGLPLPVGPNPKGVIVFLRFGGPTYKPDQIRLAEFIAVHIAQLLEHDQLVQRIANLEAERRLNQLQEDFIATVSHELLTPLGFIKGYATTLLRDDITWDVATRREFLTIIDEEADRLRELIDNLMDSSRLQAGTLKMSFQPTRIDVFIRDMMLRAKARNEKQQILIDMNSTGLKIPVDPARLAQVFDNLMTNAAKYAPNATIRISLDQEQDKVHIVLSDNGPGIPAEHLANLFKRFYRVPTNDTTVRGTGLGLFICRQIIRAHNGDIQVESMPGQGTSFHIYLPVEHTQLEHHISLRESA
jgi:signal transduction histidine kinase